jgi:hypothetical protein
VAMQMWSSRTQAFFKQDSFLSSWADFETQWNDFESLNVHDKPDQFWTASWFVSVHDADLVVAEHIKTGGQGQTRLCMCFKAGEHTYASEIQKFGAKSLTR